MSNGQETYTKSLLLPDSLQWRVTGPRSGPWHCASGGPRIVSPAQVAEANERRSGTRSGTWMKSGVYTVPKNLAIFET